MVIAVDGAGEMARDARVEDNMWRPLPAHADLRGPINERGEADEPLRKNIGSASPWD